MPRAEYRRLLTEAYDLDKPEPPAVELAAYRRFLAACEPPALEIMSGSGRFLVPLLAEGFDVDGVDASPDMLAAAAHKAAAAGLKLRQHEQKAHELALPRRYGAVFCGGGSFGLLVDDSEIAAALAGIREHLTPTGRLLLEVETPALAPGGSAGRWSGRWWRRPDGATITLRGTSGYDPDTQVEEGIGIYELFVDGRLDTTELNEWVRRFWTAAQIGTALVAAGFVVETITRAYADAPATDADLVLSVLARPSP